MARWARGRSHTGSVTPTKKLSPHALCLKACLDQSLRLLGDYGFEPYFLLLPGLLVVGNGGRLLEKLVMLLESLNLLGCLLKGLPHGAGFLS